MLNLRRWQVGQGHGGQPLIGLSIPQRTIILSSTRRLQGKSNIANFKSTDFGSSVYYTVSLSLARDFALISERRKAGRTDA